MLFLCVFFFVCLFVFCCIFFFFFFFFFLLRIRIKSIESNIWQVHWQDRVGINQYVNNYQNIPHSSKVLSVFLYFSPQLKASINENSHFASSLATEILSVSISIPKIIPDGLYYSRTSMARTPLGPWKIVRAMDSSSQ